MLPHTPQSHTASLEKHHSAPVHRLRTVVIDDSDAFLAIVCALLEREDDIDIVARGCDGAEAIELVEKFQPDLLVMDIDMPHLDGLNAALILSIRFPLTEIILMSMDDTQELRAHCIACGAVGFIHKPDFREDFPFWLEALAA